MSVVLWLVTYSLAFVLFRYNPIAYWKGILKATGVMMLVSLGIQLSGFSFMAGLIQPIFGVVFFKIFLRLKWLNSAIMILFSYEICRIFENIYVLVKTNYHISESILILKNIPRFGDVIIMISAITLFTLFLHFSKLGFTFMHTYKSPKIAANVIFLSGIILAVLLSSISLSIFIANSYFFVVLRSIAMLLLLFFLFVAYRKEMRDEF
jgi:hypothetical protein